MDGFNNFFATTNEADPNTCEVPLDASSCIINDLVADTEYLVSVEACDKTIGSENRLCSSPPVIINTKTGSFNLLKLFSRGW